MTTDCNYDCLYCYQKRAKEYLDVDTAMMAIDFFFPYLLADCSINFYGGEPLLALNQMKEVIGYLKNKSDETGKQFEYSITTNGSLIDDDVLRFLDENHFTVLLSFDGLAQELERKKGSFTPIVSVMQKILGLSHVTLETNSVFTNRTVPYLSESIRFIVDSNVPSVNLSISSLLPWDDDSLGKLEEEISILRKYCVSFFLRTGGIPVTEFRPSPRPGVFGCLAGKDRMALSPDGKLWGCCLFSDYFNTRKDKGDFMKYCFGSLPSFVKNHERLYPSCLDNYAYLGMDHFSTPEGFCALCDELEDCVVCPVEALFAGSIMRKIPPWICQIRKIMRKEKRQFLKEIQRDSA